MPEHRFVYGPVASRRLGFSLGVDVIPFKTCTLDCVYCQLGSTGRTTVRRRGFFPPRRILAQVRAAVRSGQRIDVITFSGSGEPTLNKDIGRLIRSIKRMARLPVAVLTNGTLLARREVRRDLAAADIVIPSLDAGPAELFRRVNRPHATLVNEKVIDGLARFRDEYAGEIRLEIMLVRGVNDSPAAVRALKAAVARIRPDRIELNTVVRPPAERAAKPLGAAALGRIRRELGPRAEVVASFARTKRVQASAGSLEAAVLATVRRRPQTTDDIAVALGRSRGEARKALAALLRRGRVRKIVHSGRAYFSGGPVRFT
ncbi:MAG TPA: radical SAM protein [Acidobacteriota bacterium]|nr:radical SAM protein [Acidobacteriota bacterium]